MKSLYGNFRFSVIQDKTLEMLAVFRMYHWPVSLPTLIILV